MDSRENTRRSTRSHILRNLLSSKHLGSNEAKILLELQPGRLAPFYEILLAVALAAWNEASSEDIYIETSVLHLCSQQYSLAQIKNNDHACRNNDKTRKSKGLRAIMNEETTSKAVQNVNRIAKKLATTFLARHWCMDDGDVDMKGLWWCVHRRCREGYGIEAFPITARGMYGAIKSLFADEVTTRILATDAGDRLLQRLQVSWLELGPCASDPSAAFLGSHDIPATQDELLQLLDDEGLSLELENWPGRGEPRKKRAVYAAIVDAAHRPGRELLQDVVMAD